MPERNASAQTTRAAPPVAHDQPIAAQRRGAAGLVVVGAVCGLAWATGLRGLMAEIAGFDSTVGWGGTFAGILLPGVIAGALLGWAEYLRRSGGRRGWRWLALSPLVLAAVVLTPSGVTALLEGGLGGGAIMVPLVGMLGGYALSGRGPVWARITGGAVVLASFVAWAMVATTISASLALDTPRGAWVALFFYSYLAVLALACAIPHRPVVATRQHT